MLRVYLTVMGLLWMDSALAAEESMNILKIHSPSVIDDIGQGQSIIVEIENPTSQPVILLQLNEHSFVPPNFSKIDRMKSPPADWSTWRNVLMPGQQLEVFLPQERLLPGAHDIDVELTYIRADSELGSLIQEVLPKGTKLGENQISSRFLRERHQPFFFIERSVLPKEFSTSVIKWSLEVKPDPVIQQLAEANSISQFRVDIGYFGYVVEYYYRLFQVQEDQLIPLPKMTFAGVEALGRSLETGSADIKAISLNKRLARTFSVQEVVRERVPTAEVTPYDDVKHWHQFELVPNDISKLWQLMEKENLMIDYASYEGILLLPSWD